ncbi:DUF2752 domain-containing protein [Prevotella brunnea]|uniref:DUF2752 domain-containing protein n=1 Tax=Prevotella brunnea TaxID=2508867 RepID=A0A5C8GNZ2_9BACT|nr:DUF2752 domain-containing protein [Prevotella brunnea]MDR0186960.1 DUF2752 domain-containing protein [Prevotella brunnea]TXJ62612.1 DUF2752 domain-containing protein [Prevotella brunnea]
MRKIAFLLLGAIAIGSFYFLLNPAQYRLSPKCPVKLLTGYSCPGCGAQRFLHAALHGNFGEAISYNYFLLLALPYLLVLCLLWVLPIGKWKSKWGRIAEHRYVVWTYIVIFFVWLVVRNVLHI